MGCKWRANHYFLELEPPAERLRHAPHVVIVGGGFAGVHACKALAKADVRITLIDKRNFNLFQPLLYQVATGLVSRSDVATPLRELVGTQDNVQVLLGEVTAVNPEGKQIVFNGKAYSYDHLILATGSGSTYFGHEDWRTFAPPMKILEHAEEIRRRLLMAMEQAEQTPNPEARQFLQTVVIVGGGPTGCEMAGAVSELMRWALNSAFKQLDSQKTRIVLVDPGDRVLRAMPEELSKEAQKALELNGVEFIPQGRVQTMRPGEVVISSPDGDVRIQAATVIWTAGVKPSHLGQKLTEATGCELDRGGRVIVNPDFSIPNHPEIRIAGDLCSYSHTVNGKPLPGMAAPAKQAGTFIGKGHRRDRGWSRPPHVPLFRFRQHGRGAGECRRRPAWLQSFRPSGSAALGHRPPGFDAEPGEPDHVEHQVVVRAGNPRAGHNSAHRHAEPASGP
ncbi:MAG: NADH dehydrogenase [Synechococcus sp.]|nr:MAG: NADH dehydrogenase [Synechococcus sp.]